jgi:hypothetical protein
LLGKDQKKFPAPILSELTKSSALKLSKTYFIEGSTIPALTPNFYIYAKLKTSVLKINHYILKNEKF